MNQAIQLKQTITRILLAFNFILIGYVGGFSQSVDIRQAANNKGNNGIGNVEWIESNLGSNSVYYEGMGVPQRIIANGLPNQVSHTLLLKHQSKKGTKHGYDFLISWEMAQFAAEKFRPSQPLLKYLNPYLNVPSNKQTTVDNILTIGATPGRITINPPANITGQSVATRKTAFENLMNALKGTTIPAGIEVLSTSAVSGGSLTFNGYEGGDSVAVYTLSWTTALPSSSAIIKFAGHLASSVDFFKTSNYTPVDNIGWGASNGSGSIGGSSYHINVKQVDSSSVGSQDNQISSVLSVDCSSFSLGTPTVTNITCYGANDGRISLSVSGGTTPYSYSWTGTGVSTNTTSSISNLSPGTYTVTVVDGGGIGVCLKTASFNIIQPQQLVANISSQTNVLCNGGNNGAATISVVGGTAPYTYKWGGGLSGTFTATATGISAGTYTFTVTDASSCSTTSSVTITEPTLLTGTATPTTMVSCYEKTDGVITVSGSGGTTPYSYNIVSGSYSSTNSGGIFSGLAAGSYTVTITDANSCTKTITATITQPALLTASAVATNVTCKGFNNGSIELTVSGGTATKTYLWSNSSITEDISSLAPGNYSVTVTDANGCTATASATITEPAAVLAVVSITPTGITCNGDGDGSIALEVSGGTASYTFEWSNTDQTTEDLTNLEAGNYSVTVTDANGCTTTSSATIIEPDALVATISGSSNVSCYGLNDGSINLNITGGTASYTVSWTGPSTYSNTTQNISTLYFGTYSVEVTDAHSCTSTASITITQPELLTASAVATNVTCKGFNNGSIELTVSGGTATKTYLWSNSSITEDISSLAPGNYSVTVTDANGCTATASATITEPAAVLAVVSITPTGITCNGDGDGSIALEVSGGTASYTFEWSNTDQTTEDLTNLEAGNYSVTVTDANGCTTTSSATIIEPDALVATISGSSNVSCYGLNDGSINLNITGGTASYTVSWTGPSTYSNTTQNISTLYFGTYSVEVTDAHSCTSTASITITQPQEITLSATTTKVTCFDSNDGEINVTNTNSTIQILNSLGQVVTPGFALGTYTVTATGDADGGMGCSKEISVTVDGPSSALSISSTITAVKCLGENSGKITITATGGYTSSYTYAIKIGTNTYTSTTGIFTDLLAGTYTASVTDDGGCTKEQSVTVLDGDVCYPFYTYSQGFYGNYGGKGCVSGAQRTTKQLMQEAMDYSTGLPSDKNGEIKLGLSNFLQGSITGPVGTWSYSSPTPPYNKNIGTPNVIDNIIALMPAGGPSVSFGRGFNFNIPGTLSTSQYAGYVNKNGRIANTLFGQTMAIWFSMNLPGNGDFKNLDLSQADGKNCLITKNPSSTIGCISSPGGTSVITTLPQSVITALIIREDATVEGLVRLAGEALTFGPTGATKYYYTGTHLSGPFVALSDLTAALGALVDAFHGGKYFVGFENCSTLRTASTPGFNSQVEIVSAAVTANTNEVKVTAYPNPYADRITFNITAKETGKSSLVLYNLLGQRVVSVFEGQMKANTTQTVIYNVPTLQRKNLVFVFTNGSSISTGKLMSGK